MRYDAVVDMGPNASTGKRRQRKKTYNTKKEAQAGLAAWLAEIDKGSAVDRSAHTLGELLDFWLDTYARHRVRTRTVDGYARTIHRHILPVLGGIEIQKLTPARLQAFYSERIDAGCGPRTVELCHLHISQALDQAVKLGWVSRNVADAATPPRWKPREMQTWDAEEARHFIAVAHHSIYGPIWLLRANLATCPGDWDAQGRVTGSAVARRRCRAGGCVDSADDRDAARQGGHQTAKDGDQSSRRAHATRRARRATRAQAHPGRAAARTRAAVG